MLPIHESQFILTLKASSLSCWRALQTRKAWCFYLSEAQTNPQLEFAAHHAARRKIQSDALTGASNSIFAYYPVRDCLRTEAAALSLHVESRNWFNFIFISFHPRREKLTERETIFAELTSITQVSDCAAVEKCTDLFWCKGFSLAFFLDYKSGRVGYMNANIIKQRRLESAIKYLHNCTLMHI